MPTRTELIANNKTIEEIGEAITADKVIYQDLPDLERSVKSMSNDHLHHFDASCFNGEYITGDIDEAFLAKIEAAREHSLSQRKGAEGEGMVDLNLNVAEQNLM